MNSGMNFEIYTKLQLDDMRVDSVLGQFPHYTSLMLALGGFLSVYGDNLYVRGITIDGQTVIGKLSHKAKYIVSSAQHWPLQG